MNLTETRGVIITSSPVFGLRANRSDCCQGTKDPNPFMEIDSPSRIPDIVLEQADEVVNIDLTADELLARLKAGKIYPRERGDYC